MENEAIVTMELTPEMVPVLMEAFDIEVEMLQGFVCTLPDGRSKYHIKVSGHKSALIRVFVLRMMGRLDKINLN